MAVLASDNFNRANGGPGANWTALNGTAAISTNKIVNSTGLGAYIYNAITWPNDQYSTIRMLATRPAALVRTTSSIGTSSYALHYDGSFLSVYKNDSTLLNFVSMTVNVNDLITLEVTGSSPAHLVAKVNGVSQFTYDDSSSPITTGSAGWAAWNATAQLDDWEGGDFAAAGWGGLLGHKANRLVVPVLPF
jgi:hypothetical protein